MASRRSSWTTLGPWIAARLRTGSKRAVFFNLIKEKRMATATKKAPAKKAPAKKAAPAKKPLRPRRPLQRRPRPEGRSRRRRPLRPRRPLQRRPLRPRRRLPRRPLRPRRLRLRGRPAKKAAPAKRPRCPQEGRCQTGCQEGCSQEGRCAQEGCCQARRQTGCQEGCAQNWPPPSLPLLPSLPCREACGSCQTCACCRRSGPGCQDGSEPSGCLALPDRQQALSLNTDTGALAPVSVHWQGCTRLGLVPRRGFSARLVCRTSDGLSASAHDRPAAAAQGWNTSTV